jgi:hypothetical protein
LFEIGRDGSGLGAGWEEVFRRFDLCDGGRLGKRTLIAQLMSKVISGNICMSGSSWTVVVG